MKVVFRVDSSRLIGTGHLVRCMTLGATIRERGIAVEFIGRAHRGNLLDRLSVEGFAATVLPPPSADRESASADHTVNYADWLGVPQAEDADQTIEAIAGSVPDWLVVDHYGLGAKWEARLRPHVGRILAIDDLANRSHDCDVLLDQNYAFEPQSRYRGLVPPDCRLLVGPRYALLRPEYREYRMESRTRAGNARRLLVFLGGTDRYGVTLTALEALSAPELSHLEVDVVVGTNNADRPRIEELAARRARTFVQGPRPHLADLMSAADLAIGAGGATTWERMCLGLPSVVVSVAQNQQSCCEALCAAGLIEYLGEVPRVRGDDLHRALMALIDNPERLASLTAANLVEVDGLGTPRVADVVAPTSGTVSGCGVG